MHHTTGSPIAIGFVAWPLVIGQFHHGVTVMAKGNNAQGKDRKKAKAGGKKAAKAAPAKPAPQGKKG